MKTTFCNCELCKKMRTKPAQKNIINPENCYYYLDVENGKYTVYIEKESHNFKALRYGKSWRDLTGDNLIFYLMVDLINAKDEIKRLNNELSLDEWERGEI